MLTLNLFPYLSPFCIEMNDFTRFTFIALNLALTRCCHVGRKKLCDTPSNLAFGFYLKILGNAKFQKLLKNPIKPGTRPYENL